MALTNATKLFVRMLVQLNFTYISIVKGGEEKKKGNFVHAFVISRVEASNSIRGEKKPVYMSLFIVVDCGKNNSHTNWILLTVCICPIIGRKLYYISFTMLARHCSMGKGSIIN